MVRSSNPPAMDDAIRFDEPARAAAADDFGHMVHRRPAGVVVPQTDLDVAATIRWAADQGLTVSAQGTRHSVFGRGQVAGGVVCDLSRLRRVSAVTGDRVVVEAGATWREVLTLTLPRGLAPAVLTEYLDLSVGGTLVVGGIGATTSRFGAQTDTVVELEAVVGTGERMSCSPTRNPELFDALRAGLGQVGVITRATLSLVPAPAQVRRFLLFYPDLPSMLHDQRLLAGDDRFDAVQGAVVPAPTGGWTYRLDAAGGFADNPPDDTALLAGLSDDRPSARPSTLSFLDYLTRLDGLEQALRANGQWQHPHPWLTTFVGDSAVESVVRAELAGLTSTDLGPLGQVVLSAFHRAPVTTPLLRLPTDPLCYAFNLIRLPATDNTTETDRLVKANRAVYDRVAAADGTLYPASAALPLSRDDWRRHFGPALARLSAAKRQHDPANVLRNGYEVF